MLNRRTFSMATGAALLAPTMGAYAQAPAIKAGKDYLVLSKPAPVDAAAGKVEVVEFFSYNCPHCAEFEPKLEVWLKSLPPKADFRRIPVPFVGNDTEPKQRLYYALEALGKIDALHAKLFVDIHGKREKIFGDEAILAWAAKQPELDAAKFAAMYKSFGVIGKAKRATQLTAAYQVDGVPALGVAGRYYVDGQLAGSLERALVVARDLIDQAPKA